MVKRVEFDKGDGGSWEVSLAPEFHVPRVFRNLSKGVLGIKEIKKSVFFYETILVNSVYKQF